MKHRLIPLLLVLVLTAALAACTPAESPDPAAATPAPAAATPAPAADAPADDTGDTADAAPEGLEPYEITYILLCNEIPVDADVVEAALNEQIAHLNATIKFKPVDWAGWEERALLPIQAGEKADIVFTADWQFYMRCISQNMIIPLNDPGSQYGDLLNTYAPDAVRLLGDAFIEGTQVDGVSYGVPTNKELTVPDGYSFNEDLVNKYNIDYKAIENDQQLSDIIATVKAGEGDKFYPVLMNGEWLDNYVAIAEVDGSDYVMLNDRLADGSDDMNIYWRWEDPVFLDQMAMMHDWYQKGYIDPDSALETYDITAQRGIGNWFVAYRPLTFEGNDANELMIASGNPDLHIVENIMQEARQITTHAGGSMLSIPVTSQDPARAMMFLNLMHSDELLINTMAFGVEGVHYDKVADTVVTILPNDPWTTKHAGPWTLGNQFIQWTTDAEPVDKYQKLKEFSQSGIPHPSLGFRFRPDAVENEIAAYANARSMGRAIMTGSVDPAVEIPKLVEALKAAGADTIMNEIKSQFDAWLQVK